MNSREFFTYSFPENVLFLAIVLYNPVEFFLYMCRLVYSQRLKGILCSFLEQSLFKVASTVALCPHILATLAPPYSNIYLFWFWYYFPLNSSRPPDFLILVLPFFTYSQEISPWKTAGTVAVRLTLFIFLLAETRVHADYCAMS